jgi:TonB-linked SusC/RagA family outer membrane protein
MKLTFIFILLGLMSFASVTYSQATKLSFESKNSSIESVFKQIETLSEFKFAYNSTKLDVDKKISIKVENQTIDVILDKILGSANFQYKIVDRYIIITDDAAQNSNQSGGEQSSIKVTGKVTDQSGAILPGVSVVLKGTTNGTITDANGNYSISNVPANAILQFSFVGMRMQEVKVGADATINVTLIEETVGIEEVVAVGYGTQRKEALTGAITAVKGKELEKGKTTNLSNSFAGRISGVVASTASGEPGSDGTRLLIRGMSTPDGDNSPLIVVDGVANRLGGLERIDANDIESMSVLKDASAAIYGAQAANGVILITTKKGLEGKPVFDFTYNQGFSQPTRLPKMADAATYSKIINEINYYNNPAGGMNQIYSQEAIQKYADGTDPLNYPNTNWEKETFKDIALQDRQAFSVRGGTKVVNYFVSFGRQHQDGIYKDGVLKYDQINLRSNVDFQVTENLKVGMDLSYRNSKRNYPTNSAANIFRAVYRTFPQMSAYYPGIGPSDGVESGLNPNILVTGIPGTNKQEESVINTMLNFEYKLPFAKDFTIKGFWAVDHDYNAGDLFSTPYTVYHYDKSTGIYSTVKASALTGSVSPELTMSETNDFLQTYNLSLNYEKSIGESHIKSFLAFEQNEQESKWFTAYRKGFLSAQIPVLDMGGSDPNDKTVTGNMNRFTRRNYFGRLSYDLSHKYFAEVQFRYDGSSRFPSAKQYGFFPSISTGWRISEEDWFHVSKISNLKLRASYGLLGNDRYTALPSNPNTVTSLQYLNSYAYKTNAYVLDGGPASTFGVAQLANPNITWEKAKKLDIGIEIGFLDHFNAEVDYFHELRNDLLTPRTGSIPMVSGIVNQLGSASIIPYENIGKVSNAGVEAQLGYDNSFGKLHFSIRGNITYNKSNVIFMDDAPGIPEYQKRVGKPIGSQLLYQAIGIFRTADDLKKYPSLAGNMPGDLIYQDVSGDGKITADDRVRESLSNVPQIVYGISPAFEYNNFDFNMMIQGQARVAQLVMPESGTIGNFFSSWADNRWSPDNINGTYPRVDTRTSSSINAGLNVNNFWLDNTAFLRIKSVELGYTLPASLISRLHIQKTRIYSNVSNLFTFTKVKDYDPEGTSQTAQFYPQLRLYNIGVNITF